MFTLDAVRRIPSVDTEIIEGQPARHETDDATDLRRLLTQDLCEADSAIRTGRIEDAHRALIHAQDVVFERHLALGSADPRRPVKWSTDLFLHLTNRLIDANRFKDRAIIAECRVLVDLLAETHLTGSTAPGPTLV